MRDRENPRATRRLWLDLHPLVPRIALGLIVWSVAAVWILFDHSYYALLLHGVVTFLVGAFVVVPWVLMRLGRKSKAPPSPKFGDWAHGKFDTASGPMDAREAAIMVLLLPMAVAIGITAFGLIEFLTITGVLS